MSIEAKLAQLRSAIDAIDQELLELLGKRLKVVKAVGELKGRQPIYLRPDREAQMLRRLVDLAPRYGLERSIVLLLWREMINTFTQSEGPFTVALSNDTALRDLVRDYFGRLVPLINCENGSLVLQHLSQGQAALGVLSAQDMLHADWGQISAAHYQVFAKLTPLPRSNALAGGDALVLAKLPVPETGDDWLVLGAVGNAPLPAGSQILAKHQTRCVFVIKRDPNLPRPLQVSDFTDLGGYATPVL